MPLIWELSHSPFGLSWRIRVVKEYCNMVSRTKSDLVSGNEIFSKLEEH